MLRPTNDPLQVLKRQEQVTAREADTALGASRTQSYQAVPKLQNQIDELEIVVGQMQELFNRMPQNDGRQVDTSGWSVNTAPAAGSWSTVAEASIPRPAGMNRVAVMAVGTMAGIVNDGGAAGSSQARLVIAGSAGSLVEGSAEYRGQQMRSAAHLGHFREYSPGTTVVVQLQVRGRMSEFASSNVASLSVSAGFTRVGQEMREIWLC